MKKRAMAVLAVTLLIVGVGSILWSLSGTVGADVSITGPDTDSLKAFMIFGTVMVGGSIAIFAMMLM